LQPSWLEDGYLYKAYLRKHGRDEEGLSLVCSKEFAITNTIDKGRGVAELEIEAITAIDDLQVQPEENCHGFLIGLPFVEGVRSDYNLAMQLADKLAKISNVEEIYWNRRRNSQNTSTATSPS